MSISFCCHRFYQDLQDEQGRPGPVGPSAWAERRQWLCVGNLDQRETLDHLVSSWGHGMQVFADMALPLGHGSRHAQILPQEEEGHSQGGSGLFQKTGAPGGG